MCDVDKHKEELREENNDETVDTPADTQKMKRKRHVHRKMKRMCHAQKN